MQHCVCKHSKSPGLSNFNYWLAKFSSSLRHTTCRWPHCHSTGANVSNQVTWTQLHIKQLDQARHASD